MLNVNDIQKASNFNIRLFADDTLLYFSKKKPCDLEKHVNIELDKIQQWLDVNKLSLNVSKTKCIIIPPKLKERYKFQIKLKEHLLCQTETHKYLGIIIDKKLSWKPHLSAVASKLAKLCELFYKLSRSVVEWLTHRTDDQHGLGSKPTYAILLCSWKRHFTALSPAWWS